MGVEGVNRNGDVARLDPQTSERGHVEAVRPAAPRRRSDAPNYLPDDVTNVLRDRSFRSFDAMRPELNRAMAQSPAAIAKFGFTDRDIVEMRAGRNPFCAIDGQLGGRVKYEYEHTRERRDGHPWADVDNLRLVSPSHHVRKIIRSFYKVADQS